MSERTQTHATFVLERYYPVPVDRVWDAFADPETPFWLRRGGHPSERPCGS
jgi:uncharacterized protein YndB with AHSA1/START domain